MAAADISVELSRWSEVKDTLTSAGEPFTKLPGQPEASPACFIPLLQSSQRPVSPSAITTFSRVRAKLTRKRLPISSDLTESRASCS